MPGTFPERVETSRLVLRRPCIGDAEAVFARYASDVEVTRMLSWPRHESLGDTHAFIAFSDAEWTRWPAGPYLIESRESGLLLGGTGFAFTTPVTASTGYVLARDAWGAGVASEALRCIVGLAAGGGLHRLEAVCHPDNPASRRVLEKCGFTCEGTSPGRLAFPNLGAGARCDVLRFARVFA